jgi:predicted outer membrane protein
MSTFRPCVAACTLLLLSSALTPSFAALAEPDRSFATWAAHDDVSEVQDAQDATPLHQPEPINVLAQKIIKDRTEALAGLKTVAHDENFSLPDDKASAAEQRERAKLKNLPATTQAHPNDTQRAQAYLSYEIEHLQQAVSRFDKEIATGKNAKLKMYAEKYLPTIHDELQMARSIKLQKE